MRALLVMCYLQISSNVQLLELSTRERLEHKGQFPVTGCHQLAIKTQAVMRTLCSALICLDSNNMPLRYPAKLFQAWLYHLHGNVVWSDCNINVWLLVF